MINNMNNTPYKVNEKVLYFILEHGVEYQMISDVNKKHEYYDIKRTKRQNILGIAISYLHLIYIFL